MNDLPKLLISKRFSSFEELAATVIAWKFDFRQISRSYFETTLDQTQAGNILISHLSCGCYSIHLGETPEGRYTLALSDPASTDFRYFGKVVNRPALIVTRPSEEFEICVRPGYGMSTFSIPCSILDAGYETRFGRTLDSVLGNSSGKIFPLPQSADRLRKITCHISHLSRHHPGNQNQLACCHPFESQLVDCFLEVLQPEELQPRSVPRQRRRRSLTQTMASTLLSGHDRTRVKDLAESLNVSERTLQRIFKREFGITPKRFLFGHRMYGAYRQLWHSESTDEKVADIANAWGFWHMGQFAKDFYRFFSELPSETLRRSL